MKALILVGPGKTNIDEAMRRKMELNAARVEARAQEQIESAEVKVWGHKVDLNGSAITQVTVCGLQLANGTTEYAANLLAKRLGETRYGVFEVPTGRYETRQVLE